jgi:hypothetical protein
MQLNKRHQLRPRHDMVHLVEEDLLAGLLGQRVKAERFLTHTHYRPRRSGRSPAGLMRDFADLP